MGLIRGGLKKIKEFKEIFAERIDDKLTEVTDKYYEVEENIINMPTEEDVKGEIESKEGVIKDVPKIDNDVLEEVEVPKDDVVEEMVEEVVEEKEENVEIKEEVEVSEEEVIDGIVEEVILDENTTDEQVEEVAIDKLDERVICINSGEIYENSKIASEKTGVYSGSITRCCNGSLKTAGTDEEGNKLVWKYVRDL